MEYRRSASAIPALPQSSNQKDDGIIGSQVHNDEGGNVADDDARSDKNNPKQEGAEVLGGDEHEEEETQKSYSELGHQGAPVKRKRTRTVDTTEVSGTIGSDGTKGITNNVPNGVQQRRKNTKQQKS